MDSVCKNCDIGLKRSDCSDEEYIECETRRWIREYIKHYNTDELVQLIESEYDAKDQQNNWHTTKYALLDMASFCIDRSRHY